MNKLKLRSKLLITSIVPLILALGMVGFIVMKMTQLQATNSGYVPVLVEVQKLNAKLTNAEQALSTYSSNATDGNKAAADTALGETQKEIKKLSSMPLQASHQAILTKISTKDQALIKAADSALKSGDPAAVKRQALRIRGILNDVYLLDLKTNQYYDQLTKDLKAKISFIIASAIIGSILLIVLALGFGLWMALRLSTRIRRLVTSAQQVASGHLAVSLVEDPSNDEVAELQTAFTQMVRNLRDMLASMGAVSSDLGYFAKNVEQQNQVLKEMSQQIAVSTDEMAQGSQSISADLSDAKEAVDRMSDDFDRNLDVARKSSVSSEKAVAAIKNGNEAVSQQKNLLQESIASSKQMGDSMNTFSKETEEIEKMAQLVADISNETNLLALNASIEAARAGEYGKGFAVVATEIRKLADGSQTATKQIFELVSKLNRGQKRVIDSIEESMAGIHRQETAMDQTMTSFSHIDEQVKDIDEYIQYLAERMANAQEQSQRFSQVIENISSVTEESAAGSEEISASTTEQLGSIDHMLENVEELNKTAQQLNGSIQRFSMNDEPELS